MAHDHLHAHAADADARRLGGAFVLIVVFMVAEVAGGIVGSSLALLSDAGHMLTDAIALGLALAALRLADRPPAGSVPYWVERAEAPPPQDHWPGPPLRGPPALFQRPRPVSHP